MLADSIIIKLYPRLHLTLIGMNEGGYRINGGVGLAIREPSLEVHCSISDKFSLIDRREFSLSEQEILRINNIITQEIIDNQYDKQVSVSIQGMMPTHFGFGSGTAIRLACLEGLHFLNDNKPEREKLVYSSGRGGTSGIGINSYFEGGFIVDFGKKSKEFSFCPSQISEKRKTLPLMMQRLEMPEWDIGICIPNNVPCKTEEEEVQFFKKTCPIPSSEVYKTLYNVIYGLYSGIREKDNESFCLALNDIQKCAWKHAERSQYGIDLIDIESKLYDFGAKAVGMSSLGPCLFFLADDVNSVVQKTKAELPNYTLFSTKPSNRGRSINYA